MQKREKTMNKIFYKDIKLSIHTFFFILPFLSGLLFLIPKWPYFIALMYFFWISIPNIFNSFNVQNDFGFSAIMPVGKGDIVKGKIYSVVFLELLHLAFGALFSVLHGFLYGADNFALDLGLPFFGIAFTMFGLFNIIFFPGFFRTAYRFGLPLIIGVAATTIFIGGIEIINFANPSAARYLEGTSSETVPIRLMILIGGIVLFALLTFLALRMSKQRFEKVDL
jgi:hypothetical protein